MGGDRVKVLLTPKVVLVFQSTPPYGRRPSNTITILVPIGFQSTPPYGRRLTLVPFGMLHSIYFNPRLRMGGDFSNFQVVLVIILFQSTPPYGRRPQIFNIYYSFFCSLIIYYEFCIFIVPDNLSYFI